MADVSTGAALARDALTERVHRTLRRLSQTGALPALPATASAALAVARDPEASIDELCRIVQADVGIAARVLRVANSASLARRMPARTLRDAIVGIGLRETCNILVLAATRQMYAVPGRHAQALWDHALAAAVAAEELAQVTGRLEPPLAFLPGLFHDVGRIAFLLADGMAFEVIHTLAASSETPRRQLEHEWYGFDHAEAGSILAETWGLDRDLCDAIRCHHEPARAAGLRPLAELIEAADYLAWAIGFGTGPERPPTTGLGALGLSPEDEAVCAERVRQAFAQHRELLAR
jgi:HD-like signal output (HDOD) protein